MLCNAPSRLNKPLIFKAFLFLTCASIIACEAFAFGGIGIGPWQRHKSSGVDAIGIHIDPNAKPMEPIKDCDPTCPENYTCVDGKCLWSAGETEYCSNPDAYNGSYYSCNAEDRWAKCPYDSWPNRDELMTGNSQGICADSPEQSVWCVRTWDNGHCAEWRVCGTANSSGRSIVGTPNAFGYCGNL